MLLSEQGKQALAKAPYQAERERQRIALLTDTHPECHRSPSQRNAHALPLKWPVCSLLTSGY